MASELPPPVQTMSLDLDESELNLNDDSLLPEGEGIVEGTGDGTSHARVRNTKSMPYELRIAIITMKFMCEWNFKQIAKKLNIPRTTASKFWHTTLERCDNPNDFHSLCAAAVALKRGRPKKGEEARKPATQANTAPMGPPASLPGINQAAQIYPADAVDPSLQHLPPQNPQMMGQYLPMPNGYQPAMAAGMAQ